MQLDRRDDSRACCTAGSNSATSVPMIAITTNSSTSVKPRTRRLVMCLLLPQDDCPVPRAQIGPRIHSQRRAPIIPRLRHSRERHDSPSVAAPRLPAPRLSAPLLPAPMSTHQLHTDHARLFEHNRFVYPVLSRRSGGISIGVNLNPDKICNFDCIYCQVDRTQPERNAVRRDRRPAGRTARDARPGRVRARSTKREKFRDVPPHLRRLNDIAFSGDGEPTTYGISTR